MRNKKFLLLCVGAMTLVLSACVLFAPPEVEPWPTATATPLPTETPVWFPATATPTRVPPAAPPPLPTPNQLPGVGALILLDEFEEGEGWQAFRRDDGGVALEPGKLTISVNSGDGYITTFRNAPTVDDFYLKVEANPRLCQASDSYGLLLRAASGLDYYRFSVTVDGQVRVDRFKNGNVVLLQNWTPSGQVPSGCPVFLRLGVWAVGDEMRFFINDVYQFTVRDTAIPRGQIGFFARSRTSAVFSVSFSDLELRRIDSVQAPVNATPEPVIMLTLAAE